MGKKKGKQKPPDPPRVLGRRLLHRYSPRGYTELPEFAMYPDVGEAPDEFLQEHQQADAIDRALTERAARRMAQRALPLEHQIVALQKEAAHRRIDIRSEVRVLKRSLNNPGDVEKHVVRIEAKLDVAIERKAA